MKPDNVKSNDCWDSVSLQANTMRPSNILNLITAYDKSKYKLLISNLIEFYTDSYETLRSEAKIAKVHRLAIEVRYRQITVNTNYKLKLIGYDEQGNKFSTLDGF